MWFVLTEIKQRRALSSPTSLGEASARRCGCVDGPRGALLALQLVRRAQRHGRAVGARLVVDCAERERRLRAQEAQPPRKAKALLEDEALGKAFDEIEKRFFERWKATTDPTERDRCWMAVNLSGQVKSMLGVFVSNGKLSQSDLDAVLAQEKAA